MVAMKQMLGSMVIGAAAVLLVAACGCVMGPTPDVPDDMDPADEPTGARLAAIILQEDPFQQWGEFPERQGSLPSVLPHGPMSRVFINGRVESALADFEGRLPDGSIIVKQNVGTDPQVTEAALTVMWKVAGFDPANNDWFWANMSLEGRIASEGRIPSCAGCHGGARRNDFVFVHTFR